MTRFATLTRSIAALVVTASVAFAGVTSAKASTIEMQTRYSTASAQSSAAAYKSTIDSLMAAPATAGYGDRVVNSFSNLSNSSVFGGPNTNIAFRYTVDFSAASAGTWNFRVGPDFGKGGAVFMDGVAVGYNSNDMWWAGSYSNSSQTFSFAKALTSGNHELTIYGLEGCCDGSQAAQFQAAGSSSYTTFATNDGIAPVAAQASGNGSGVPEPTGLSVLAFGGLALAGLARRRAVRVAA